MRQSDEAAWAKPWYTSGPTDAFPGEKLVGGIDCYHHRAEGWDAALGRQGTG